MAKATIVDGMSNVKTLKLAHTAAVEAREVIVSGDNVLVAVSAADANAENVYAHRGRVSFPKATGAIPPAVKVYWDESAGIITTTLTNNTKAGITIEAAADMDSEVFVALKEN